MYSINCAHCKNAIGKYNGQGSLEVICPFCRTVNSFKETSFRKRGCFGGDFDIDCKAYFCTGCESLLVRYDGKAFFEVLCKKCGVLNRVEGRIREGFDYHKDFMDKREQIKLTA